MAAYVMANVDVLDAAGFAPYREGVPATIAQYGGRYLARGGSTEVFEGDFLPKRMVLLEFPDITSVHAWLASPEYKPLIEIRQRTAKTDIVIIEGL